MQLHHCLGQRKAETCTLLRGPAALRFLRDLSERLQRLRDFFLLDSYSLIGNRYDHTAFGRHFRRNRNCPASRRKLHGVGQNIDQNLPDQALIGEREAMAWSNIEPMLGPIAALPIPAIEHRRVCVVTHPQALLPSTTLAQVADEIRLWIETLEDTGP